MGIAREPLIFHPGPKLVYRQENETRTVLGINGMRIGAQAVAVMAGPCAVEDLFQMRAIAAAIKPLGISILRGGAYKPRTSPYSFQGLGRPGLEILAQVRTEYDLLVVTEVMSPEDVPLVAAHADILQVGSRNMQNFPLLRAVGATDKPVLLKRGMMSTLEEFMNSAEYILLEGNSRVMLCERGIRTFEPSTRNTFDINAIPFLQRVSHLPVIADPSHGTGRRDLVGPVAKAAIAAGADGLLIEVHPWPDRAQSDGQQSISPDELEQLMNDLRAVATAVGREL